ncbi:MAG: NTP transferase domain-containing protein [Gammaproteobacteria bacterium]|nr:NTP transferase domain-containing protein [Gammaproteobacteria bacterium]NNL06530.1 NTP transferase domain-containing protein [Gammaproteobacteria bacterium]
MRAIILAGGKGTRLRPYTTLIPKPLVPIGGKYSILEVVLMQLADAGFSHVTLAVNHLANLIQAYFGNGERWGLEIDYSLEDKPLNTIGPLTLIDDLPENFLVMNGDILCDLDYQKFFQHHVDTNADVSVSSFRRDVKVDFGVLEYNKQHRLTSFKEKPEYHFDVSMGIYCINRRIIDKLSKGSSYGFDELMVDGIARGDHISIRPFDGFWLDIGRPDDYAYADEHFSEFADHFKFLQ